MSLPPPRRYRRVSLVVFGLITVAMVLLAVRRDRLAKPGGTLQFDDFSFTIRDVTLVGSARFQHGPGAPDGRVCRHNDG